MRDELAFDTGQVSGEVLSTTPSRQSGPLKKTDEITPFILTRWPRITDRTQRTITCSTNLARRKENRLYRILVYRFLYLSPGSYDGKPSINKQIWDDKRKALSVRETRASNFRIHRVDQDTQSMVDTDTLYHVHNRQHNYNTAPLRIREGLPEVCQSHGEKIEECLYVR